MSLLDLKEASGDLDNNEDVLMNDSIDKKISQDETEKSDETPSKTERFTEAELPLEEISKDELTSLEDLSNFALKLLNYLDNESQDTISYRLDPKERFENNLDLDLNLKFFRNEIPALPNKESLSDIWLKWRDNYELLEQNHAYIQWLFPIYSQGMNYQSHPLQLHEYETLKSELEKTQQSLLESFDMMLQFYGAKLDKVNVKIVRRKEYKSRYSNLIRRSHNYLRISRILKCLGDFQLEDYQISWIRFLINEIFVEQKLVELAESFTRYWIHTVRDDAKREQLKQEVKEIIIRNDL